jgi:hypothetical protein
MALIRAVKSVSEQRFPSQSFRGSLWRGDAGWRNSDGTEKKPLNVPWFAPAQVKNIFGQQVLLVFHGNSSTA